MLGCKFRSIYLSTYSYLEMGLRSSPSPLFKLSIGVMLSEIEVHPLEVVVEFD